MYRIPAGIPLFWNSLIVLEDLISFVFHFFSQISGHWMFSPLLPVPSGGIGRWAVPRFYRRGPPSSQVSYRDSKLT